VSILDFGDGHKNEDGDWAIEPGMLGFVNSCYQLGSIFAVPFAPWVANNYGRRWSIMLGSVIMVVGALLQGFAQHGKYLFCSNALRCAGHSSRID
jgi:MFS family permease